MIWLALACTRPPADAADSPATDSSPEDSEELEHVECTYVEEGWGELGEVDIQVEVVAEDLAIPWGIDWLPDGRMLMTERDGRISTVLDGEVSEVGQLEVTSSGEGGLLGLALHPSEADAFFVYATVEADFGDVNQVQRWRLDGDVASFEEIVVDAIPARQFHNGGRLRIGPDDKLYIGTGDAGEPSRSQDLEDPAGKLLRVELDGSIPGDNPHGNAIWLSGVRNTQGFDWLDDGRVLLTDHGPSGLSNEDGRSDHDEVTLASPGDNLGWPEIYACEEAEGFLTPSITFANAMPPGGAAIYTGTEIPEWQGDLIIGVMGFSSTTPHLHRLRLDEAGNVELSEVYLPDVHGRLREVVMGPDGGLYVTTSNCDGRGTCGEGDRVLRIGR